jgi:hypothetical protein
VQANPMSNNDKYGGKQHRQVKHQTMVVKRKESNMWFPRLLRG